MNKFGIALTVYLALAILVCFTLSDQRIRWVTLAILGLFTVRTVTHELRMRAEAEDK